MHRRDKQEQHSDKCVVPVAGADMLMWAKQDSAFGIER